MSHRFCTIVLLSLVCGPALGVQRAEAQTPFSVSANVGDFHVAVANYYHVPEREVVVIRERRIPDDEIPIALFIAQRAVVSTATVIDFRLRGNSWWDISLRFGLSPEVYYVPVTVTPGPPYGKAYGHYKKKPKHQWNTIVLTDADIVNLVQLRFLSEHYRVPPERIIELRGSNRDFIAVHANVRVNSSVDKRADSRSSSGRGKSKKRGR
jgi:hypothetical protein